MNNKGTILYIGGFELPDKNAAAQRVIANGKLLRDLGYKVVFDGIAKESMEDIHINTPNLYFNFESYAQKYPSGFVNWFRFIIELKRYIKLIRRYRNVKIIIGYNLPSGSLYRLLKYCRRRKIKLISDCTEWYPDPKGGNYVRRWIKKLDIYLRMKVINPRLDGIISISDYLNNFYLEKNAKSVRIPPLVDLEDQKWKIQRKQTNYILQLLYAGSPFSPFNKSNVKDRLDLIIHSLAALKKEGYKFKFHIVGISKDNLMNFFSELKDDVEFLDDTAEFHGQLPHQKTIELLKTSDYSIFLRDKNVSTLAGFPTKFVESISSGIPVLTNRNSNLDEFLQEGVNGYWINTENENTIKESLLRAISAGIEKIGEMKVNCISSALFDYRNYRKEFKNFLESIEKCDLLY